MRLRRHASGALLPRLRHSGLLHRVRVQCQPLHGGVKAPILSWSWRLCPLVARWTRGNVYHPDSASCVQCLQRHTCIESGDACEVQLLRSVGRTALECYLHAIQGRKPCDALQLPLKACQPIWARSDTEAIASAVVIDLHHELTTR